MKKHFYSRAEFRRSDAIRSESDILDAAEKQLVDPAFKKFSMTRLAKESGYSPGTVYKKFSNSQMALTAIIVRYFEKDVETFYEKCREANANDILTHVEILIDVRFNNQQKKGIIFKVVSQIILKNSNLVTEIVKFQFAICSKGLKFINENSSDSNNENISDLVPLVNGLLFGAQRSNFIANDSALNDNQIAILKKNLVSLLKL
jgi:AcrR family transcriptional regulator